MKKALGLIGASLLFAGPAFAADLAVKAPVYKAPPPVYNWTGFYVGGNVGGVLGHASGTSNFLDPSTTIYSTSNPQSNSFSNGGALAGVQGGYNWQINQWGVVGVEGDWDWGTSKYSFCRQTDTLSVACVDNISNAFGFESIGSKLDWLATARARAGVLATPWLLLYGTGGAAWGSVDTTLSQNCLADGCGSSITQLALSSTTTNIRTGWVGGAGAEAMLSGHWLLRGEWLHVDLGTFSNALSSTGNTGVQTTTWLRSEKFDEFRAALSYKF